MSNKLDGNIRDVGYRTQDGDAAFLEPGTPIYSVSAYHPSFRVAARMNGRIFLFEADRAWRARRGADFLDLTGKVDSLRIYRAESHRPYESTVTTPEQLARLVTMVLDAPLDLQAWRASDERGQLLVFHFRDGTGMLRGYSSASGRLAPGLLLPAEFGASIEAAVRNSSAAPGTLQVVRPPAVCGID